MIPKIKKWWRKIAFFRKYRSLTKKGEDLRTLFELVDFLKETREFESQYEYEIEQYCGNSSIEKSKRGGKNKEGY